MKYTNIHREGIQKKSENLEKVASPEIKIGIPAYINKSFIRLELDRMEIYNRLFSVNTDSEIAQIEQEVEDRFGQGPEQFKILLEVARLKFRLETLRASKILALTEQKFEIKKKFTHKN